MQVRITNTLLLNDYLKKYIQENSALLITLSNDIKYK